MKASELRIGNWVDIEGLQTQVIAIDSVHSHKETIGSIGYWHEENGTRLWQKSKWLDKFKPIPLTEEWLVKFGFEYSDLNGDSGLWKIPPFQIYGKYNQFIYEYALDVNYVHQLQNLYFALTGEELNQNKDDNSIDNFNNNSIPSV